MLCRDVPMWSCSEEASSAVSWSELREKFLLLDAYCALHSAATMRSGEASIRRA